ncbi:hypothetical protein [Curtobacterium flaccumfaciens]|uniref:hypothetical protein n=1 Tax=Curtobacterium flaccumfaciens TaxID=2035 RepID=UPI0039941F67
MTAGEIAALVVGIVAAAIAVASAGIAVRANGIAKAANLEAEKANRIAEEALHVQKTSLPPAWSGALQISKSKVAFQNQSGRHIIVTNVEAVPIEADGLVRYDTNPPTRIEYGDAYEIYVLRTMGGSAEALRITWRFEDEEETQVTERRL